MNIVVLKGGGENHVWADPESVRKLVALKATVLVETDAGLKAASTDDSYTQAGAQLSADRVALMAQADVLVTVNRPTAEDFSLLKKGAVVIGFLRPLDEPAELEPALERGLTTFAMELIPRITRQAMDTLI